MNINTTVLALVSVVIFSCTVAPTELKIKIYGQGAGFSGSYAIDNDDTETDFVASESTSDIYQYIETVEIDKNIVIDIFPAATDDENDAQNETDMTALTCRIYNSNGYIVYEETYSITSTTLKTFVFDLNDSSSDT